MLLDETLVFSEEQAITAEAPSTNVVDQGAAGDAFNALFVVVNVKEDFAGSISYLDIDVETSDDASFDEPKVLATVQAPVAALKKGETIAALRLPFGCKKFIRLNYVPDASASAGKVKAFLTDMAPIGHK